MDKKKIFVGNLPWSIDSAGLGDLFSTYGKIVDAVIISNKMTGQSRGFGFVTFETEEAAEKAIAEMNNKDIEGRNIVVNIAKKREERTSSSNRGGYRKRY